LNATAYRFYVLPIESNVPPSVYTVIPGGKNRRKNGRKKMVTN